jgi:hypothetical protein
MKKLFIAQTGYGHWRVSFRYRNYDLSAITTNSRAIDWYRSDDFEKVGRKKAQKLGFELLKNEVLKSYNFS